MAENANPAEAVAVTVTEDNNTKPKQGCKKTKRMGSKLLIQVKHFIIALTILSFIFSLPVLFSVIWLFYMRHYDCEELLRLPKLQVDIAIGLIFVFLVSNLVVYFRARFPVPGLLLVMMFLIVMLNIALALVGAYNMESQSIPGSPKWLKMEVGTVNNWDNIKSCIYDTRTCDDLASRSFMLTAYEFTRSKLSPIESGCCRPPVNCGMEYINATFWNKEGAVVPDSSIPYDTDCDLWNNKENVLCYNCHACKEGFLSTIEGKWWKLGTFLLVMSVLLIVSHLLLFVATMWEQYGG